MTAVLAARPRALRRGAVALTTVAALTGVGLAMGSASAATLPQTVQVTVGGGRTQTSTHDLSAGWTTFDVTSHSQAGHDGLAQVFQLRPGITLAKLQHDLVAQGSDFGAGFTTVISQETVLYGGVDAAAGTSETFASYLTPGTYYLLNASYASSSIANDAQLLTVHGPTRHSTAPASHGTVLMKDMRFYPYSTHLPKAGTFTLENSPKDMADDIHFLDMIPVKTGTTDAEVQAYFNAVIAGTAKGNPSFNKNGPQAESAILTPGRSELFSYDLPAGTYVLACFITDADTGLPHAFMGMHKVVTVG